MRAAAFPAASALPAYVPQRWVRAPLRRRRLAPPPAHPGFTHVRNYCAAYRLCCGILASVVGYFPAALRSSSAHAALFLAWRERDSRLSSAVHILWSRCGALFSGIHSAAPGLRRSAWILRWLHRHAIYGRTQHDPGREYPVPSLQQPQIKIIRCTGMPALRWMALWEARAITAILNYVLSSAVTCCERFADPIILLRRDIPKFSRALAPFRTLLSIHLPHTRAQRAAQRASGAAHNKKTNKAQRQLHQKVCPSPPVRS